jgi:hypothetical protein
MTNTLIVETRRSKGVHKADLTKFSKEEIKTALDFFNSSSYVAVRNYRSKADNAEVTEIKFHRQGVKGVVKYSLKTILSKDDFKAVGFVETTNKNLHLTQSGCTIDKAFDVEVKEPVKKIASKKTKAEKANDKKGEADPAKKTPLTHPATKTAEAKTEEKVAAKTPLPAKA